MFVNKEHDDELGLWGEGLGGGVGKGFQGHEIQSQTEGLFFFINVS